MSEIAIERQYAGQPLPEGDFAGRSLRLQTLIRLRWLAVVGQAIAVGVVHAGLGFPLPLFWCVALIALSAALNIALRVAFPASHRLRAEPAFLMLSYDALQLGALLFLTGGLDNPFAILLLVPVIVSATTLAPFPTMMLGAIVVVVATVLAISHLPLPWTAGEGFEPPWIYTVGVWLALVSACAFTGTYTFQVAEEARKLARALNATEMVLAREQHLSALDGLAAAAAHELGTPLATIALVARELQREMAPDDRHAEDIALLNSQAQRCRDILGKLTSMSGELDVAIARQPVTHLLEPIGRRNPAVMQAFANLIENAVDFADNRVEIGISWNEREVAVTIRDDGRGFTPAILSRIGEPYVTTRGPSGDDRADHEAGGLGLGLFIAKTLLERTGARLTFGNAEPPARGAIVRVAWPRARIEEKDVSKPAHERTGG
ncbi:MAG: ActS/PrrB/RegB family redox-sensitive histidine kinase [Rhizobiales bacterium]|nr:ActS/PrrB/RegB family redox-sensitive histidine kinase [Hyphomicrobiales bacterium]